ncbi:hypothetical protein WJT86_04945 [Microvirga sp. W0021]|uniref:Uncharacterized protein n=1 Tax=Hohaiivirga grylli TaxID=3133970 RepID=A0ABV0BLJ1_9HYPH
MAVFIGITFSGTGREQPVSQDSILKDLGTTGAKPTDADLSHLRYPTLREYII